MPGPQAIKVVVPEGVRPTLRRQSRRSLPTAPARLALRARRSDSHATRKALEAPWTSQARSVARVIASKPSGAAKPPPSTNRSSWDERERLAARGAAHAEAIRQLLEKLSAANGGAWPRHVHVAVAEALGLPRGVVHAFLSGLREQERRRTSQNQPVPRRREWRR
jgi:hypothetical protein